MSHLPETLFCFLRTGYLAVGIFFVLSGFVLSYSYSLVNPWSRSQAVRFAVARFARIYPAYCIGLVLVTPFVYSVVRHYSASRLGEASVTALLNWTLLQAWIPRAAITWNSPGWSLSAEAFFYCCFPLVGVALWRLSRLRSLAIAGSLIWAAMLIAPILAVSLPLSGFGDVSATSLHLHADPFWASLIKFNPLLCLPDFCIGIVTCRVYHQLLSKNSRLFGRGYYLYLPGILLEILAISRANSLPYPLVHNGLLTPIHALVILGLALGGGVLSRLLSIRPLVFLGNASYSMYILHIPVGTWMSLIQKRFSIPFSDVGAFSLYMLVVVCVSAIVFKYVEEPANRILKKKLNLWFETSRQRKAAAVLAEA